MILRRPLQNVVILSLPLLGILATCAGGCPRVQNGVVDAVQNTTVSVVNSNYTNDPAELLSRGIFSAIFGAFLDHFRVQIGN